MKIYLVAVLMVFVSSQVMACEEFDRIAKELFIEYDKNEDGYVDAGEWDNANSYFFGLVKNARYYGKFDEYLKKYDKNNDKKLSKEEFYPNFYTQDIHHKTDC